MPTPARPPLYLVDDDASVITIYKIGHRKDVYR